MSLIREDFIRRFRPGAGARPRAPAAADSPGVRVIAPERRSASAAPITDKVRFQPAGHPMLAGRCTQPVGHQDSARSANATPPARPRPPWRWSMASSPSSHSVRATSTGSIPGAGRLDVARADPPRPRWAPRVGGESARRGEPPGDSCGRGYKRRVAWSCRARGSFRRGALPVLHAVAARGLDRFAGHARRLL